MNEPSEVLDAEKPITEYNPIRAAIAELATKYKGILFDVSTTKGMEAAKAARAEVREPRYNVEKIRKLLKEPALAFAKRIDDEAKEYTASLLAIETPIDGVIKSEELRKAAEKAERERIQAKRDEEIQTRIGEIGLALVAAAGKSSAEVAVAIDNLASIKITEVDYGDRAGEAEVLRRRALVTLGEVLAAVEAQEAEQKRLVTERLAFEREQIAVREKAEAARKEEEARLALEREKSRRKQAEQQAINDAARKEIEEARQKLEAEQAEARRIAEAAQAEIDRKQAELDAQRAASAKEEQDRVESELNAKREAEESARLLAESKAKADAEEEARRMRQQFSKNGPGDDAIIAHLSEFYNVHESSVITWLLAMDLDAVSKRLAEEFA